MADKFGFKLGIDGEKEFKQILGDIGRNMKVLNSEMNLVASAFNKDDTSKKKAAETTRVLNKLIEEQKTKIDALKKALDNAASTYGANAKQTQDWQIKLNQANAELKNMERQSKETTKSIKSTGDEADRSKNKLKEMGNIAGAAGKMMAGAFAAVLGAGIAAGAGIVKMAGSTAAFADEMDKTAEKTGLTTTRVQELNYTAKMVNIDLETVTKSFGFLVKAMAGGTDETKGSGLAFATLGIETRNADKSMRDSRQVWEEAIGKLGNVANETERDAIAFKLFGRGAQELNPLIKQGADGLKKFTDEAHNLGVILSEEAIAKAHEYDKALDRLKFTTTAVAQNIGLAAIPMIQEFVGEISTIAQEITKSIKSGDWSAATEAISNGLSKVLKGATKAMPGMIDIGAQIMIDLIEAIIKAIPDILPLLTKAVLDIIGTIVDLFGSQGPVLIDTGMNAIIQLIEGIWKVLPQIIDAGLKIIVALIDSITEQIPKLIPMGIQIIGQIIETILDNLPALLTAGLQLILALADGLIEATPDMIKMLPQIIDGILNFLILATPQIIDAGFQLLASLTDNMPQIIDAIVQVLPQIIAGIIAALIKLTPEIIIGGFNLLVAMIADLNNIIIEICKAVPKIVKGIVDTLRGHGPTLKQAGANMAMEINDGFQRNLKMNEIVANAGLGQVSGNFDYDNAGDQAAENDFMSGKKIPTIKSNIAPPIAKTIPIITNYGAALDGASGSTKKLDDKTKEAEENIKKMESAINKVADSIKDTLKDIYKANYAVYEGSFKTINDMIQKSADDEKWATKTIYEAKKEALDKEREDIKNTYTQKKEMVQQDYEETLARIDKEIDQAEKAEERRKKLREDAREQEDRNHDQRLKDIEDEAAAKNKEIDDQIAAIDRVTAAEDKAARQQDQRDKLIELKKQYIDVQAKIGKAATPEDRKKLEKEAKELEKEYSREVKAIKREDLLEQREEQKQNLADGKKFNDAVKDALTQNEIAKQTIKMQGFDAETAKQEEGYKKQQENFTTQKTDAKLHYDYLIGEFDRWALEQTTKLSEIEKQEDQNYKNEIARIDGRLKAEKQFLEDEKASKKEAMEKGTTDQALTGQTMTILQSGDAKKWLDENNPGWASGLKGIGQQITEGVAKGMNDPAQTDKALTEWVASFLKGFNDKFDIHSPSGVMEIKARDEVMAGFIDGLDKEKGTLKDTADRLRETFTKAFDQDNLGIIAAGQQIATDLASGIEQGAKIVATAGNNLGSAVLDGLGQGIGDNLSAYGPSGSAGGNYFSSGPYLGNGTNPLLFGTGPSDQFGDWAEQTNGPRYRSGEDSLVTYNKWMAAQRQIRDAVQTPEQFNQLQDARKTGKSFIDTINIITPKGTPSEISEAVSSTAQSLSFQSGGVF